MASADVLPGDLFDGRSARRGFALNKLCFSLNSEANRQRFLADEAAYMQRFGLDDRQQQAVRERDVTAMLAAGGNIYYLAKLAGTLGLGVQDIGAQMTGVSVEAFKAALAEAGR